MLQFELPYPPSVNRYYRHVGARTLLSRQGRRYRECVCAILRISPDKQLTGPLELWIDAHPPDRRRRDADNILKSCLDALQQAGIYRDDNQVKILHVAMASPISGGNISVRIREMSDAQG